jgi:hypothetical protein
VDPHLADRRIPGPVEAALFSCSVGAVREFTQLAGIHLSLTADEVEVVVRGTRRDPGDDLQAVLDRAEAHGGSVTTSVDELVVRIPQDGVPTLVGGLGPEL